MIFGVRIHRHLIDPIVKSDFRDFAILDSFGQFWIVLDSFESEKNSLLRSSVIFFEGMR